MIDAILSFVHVLVGLGAAVGAIQSETLAIGAILLAAALVVALVGVFSGPPSAHGALVRARRSIDVSAPLAQSDPDADGHPRSRAPGLAATAA